MSQPSNRTSSPPRKEDRESATRWQTLADMAELRFRSASEEIKKERDTAVEAAWASRNMPLAGCAHRVLELEGDYTAKLVRLRLDIYRKMANDNSPELRSEAAFAGSTKADRGSRSRAVRVAQIRY